MKTLNWFTHTNISTKDYQDISIDLTEFLDIFISNCIWDKRRYRTEYDSEFTRDDIEKIKKIKINIHSHNAPFSNAHQYENILAKYFDLDSIERSKIASSGISESSKIAVVSVQFESSNKIIDYLTYQEEKDIETVFEKRLTSENEESWIELTRIKSIVCEFIQFFNFNLHLNFLTHSYDFSFSEKPDLIGFTVVAEDGNIYFEVDKIDFFAHYVLYERENDNLIELMKTTSKFWHKEIPSIHFFLDALKGNYITYTNFLKLVFTVESFFGEKASNDFMSLTIPLILSDSISKMKDFRKVLMDSFSLRHKIVHGDRLYKFKTHSQKDKNLKDIVNLFYKLKNLIILIFYFYINEELYHNRQNEKINHEMIFRLLPTGLHNIQFNEKP